jgi:class 3 adenylate cyclase
MLNRVFSGFDELADRHGVEKIKTIGDAYMAAGGLIVRNPDHLAAIAAMALAMQDSVRGLKGDYASLNLRIGLHVGSVIAGVIGIRKFIYDIWGDAVNIASRLESHGAPGRIHVSDAVFQGLQGRFAFDPRGSIDLKGRGPMQTFFLNAPPP